MTQTSSLTEFAARLRRFMARSLTGGTIPTPRVDAEFESLALDLFALQFESNAAYRRLCEARGDSPATIAAWSDIPAVPTDAFKELEITSLLAHERDVVFHSSGTTTQRPSRHFHNSESLALYEESALAWFQANLLPEAAGYTDDKIDFISLTPPQAQAPRSSLVRMFEAMRNKFGSAHSAFCGRTTTDGAWAMEQGRAESLLREASESGRPLFVLGTAFSFVHLLDGLCERHTRIELPSGSRALETGGYKGRSRELSKPGLHALITERLGIRAEDIVCEYGMSELSSQAYDAASGSSRTRHRELRTFRFPPWARVQVISPETGREVGEGETGLLRVFDLANVWSVLAVQTTDLAVRRADGFELLGRARNTDPRGCSLMAV